MKPSTHCPSLLSFFLAWKKCIILQLFGSEVWHSSHWNKIKVVAGCAPFQKLLERICSLLIWVVGGIQFLVVIRWSISIFYIIYSRILIPTWTQPDLLSLLLGCGLCLYHLNLRHQESANFAIFLPPLSLYNLFHICSTSPLVKGHSASINKYTRWELQQKGELTPSREGLPS